MVEYDKRLKNCENKGSNLDPKLKQALTNAIQKLDKEKTELSKRLAELEKPILLIQEALAKSCFAMGLGWAPANELQSGMDLLPASGVWVRVDGVDDADDADELEVVYYPSVADLKNLRVSVYSPARRRIAEGRNGDSNQIVQ